MTSPTITAFLLARLADDIALACHVGELHPDGSHDEDADNGYAVSAEMHALAARVLADVAAKRQIVNEYLAMEPEGLLDRVMMPSIRAVYEHILRALASPYASHEAYDPSWALT